MLRPAAVLLLMSLIAPAASAQPKDGDLIVALQSPPLTVVIDASTGAWTTLLSVFPVNHYPTYVQMATDNHDLMLNTQYGVFRVAPSGVYVTIARSSQLMRGLELDYDGRWLIPTFTYQQSVMMALDDATGVLSTLYMDSSGGLDQEMAIDRDPLAPPYAIASYSANLIASDRTRRLGTIASVSAWHIHGVELNPVTGDYLTTAIGNPGVALVSKTGRVTTLSVNVVGPAAARFNQDGTAWVTNNWRPPGLTKVDMQGTVITSLPLLGVASQGVGIEVYGSRRLVCNGTGAPGSTIQVKLQSRKPGDGAKPYALACSFFRRPGLRLAGGEWLNLTPDLLFRLSALGRAPAIFQGFQGVTDGFGDATARVHLPASLPHNLGTTIFVAGVVYDATGIRTVTNTHWFVLN